MKRHQITIDRLALGGNGVGKIEGKVCFVPFGVPGDRLDIQIVTEQRSWSEGQLLEIIEPSPSRVIPRCPVFGQCGGCNWQHIDYGQQCRAKQQILAETLQRIGKQTDLHIQSTVASRHAYGYRARAQFKLHLTPDGLVAGFYRRGSRFVIDLPDGCPVVTNEINSAMARIRELLVQVADCQRIPQVSLEQGDAGVVAIIHYIGTDRKRLSSFLCAHQDQLQLSGLFLQEGRKDSLQQVFGKGRLTYCVPDCYTGTQIALGYDIGGFSQVNRLQNQVMICLVAKYLRPERDQHLLDLFCGNGNLSLPLAGMLSSVTGIEGFPLSVASAVDNARQLRVNNSTFLCDDVAGSIAQLVTQSRKFNLILLDPPRAGAAASIKLLGNFDAQRVVYVSCDPATLARDLAILCGNSGYRIREVTPLDMFPQTSHLETVAVLEK